MECVKQIAACICGAGADEKKEPEKEMTTPEKEYYEKIGRH